MAKGMTFNAVLKLQKEQFDKGIRSVQASLKGLQNTFLSVAGALGAGLGLTQLLSGLKNTAVQLSVAKNTLENVSHVQKEWGEGVEKNTVIINNYAENLEFVRRLSREYGQDLTGLIQGFAQFHAACQNTNITLEQQKGIYEALTKAAAFYHMSAERSRDMNTAIIQMASKGRVTAEELRRQLGNNLPGAFNIMAAALQMSTADLDKFMRAGKITAEDALPKFAAMLNTITKGGNFDSLQMSMNRLKNAWTEMVDKSNFEGMYNKIIKGATGVVNYMANNFWPTIFGVGGAFLGLFAKNAFTKFSAKVDTELDSMKQSYIATRREAEKLNDEIIKGGRNPYITRYRPERPKGGNRGVNNAFQVHANQFTNDFTTNPTGVDVAGFKKAAKEAIKYNETLLKLNKTRKDLYGKGILSKSEVKTLQNNIAQTKVVLQGLDWNAPAEGMKASTAAGRAFLGVIKSIGAALYSIGITALAMAIVGTITSAIKAFKDYKKELKEAQNIHNEYLKDVERTDEATAENAALLRSQLRILQDTGKSEAARIKALEKINELTGEKYSTEIIKQKDAINEANRALGKTANAYQDIIDKVGKWIEATKTQAKIQVQAQRQAMAQGEIDRLEAENKELSEQIWNPKDLKEQFSRVANRRRFAVNAAAIEQYRKVIKSTESALDELGVKLADVFSTSSGKTSPDDTKLKGIPKIMEDYKNAVDELNASLRQGIITQAEFDKQLDKLNIETWHKAGKTGKLDINAIMGKVDKGQTLSEMERWYYDIAAAARAAAAKAISADLDKDIAKAVDEFVKELDKEIEKLDEEQEVIGKVAKVEGLMAMGVPRAGKRDNFFDYKKEDYEILEESVKKLNEYREKLKDLRDELSELKGQMGKNWTPEMQAFLDEVIKKLTEAGFAAEVLSEKAKFAELTKDVKDFKRELDDAKFDNLKNVAQSFDRLTQGIESVKSAMETLQNGGDGWLDQLRAMISIISELIQALETFKSIQEGIRKVQEATAAYEKAAAAEKAASYTAQVAGLGKAAAAETASAGATIAAETAKQTALDTTTASAGAAAVAGATSSQAAIPVVGPILAAAAAAAIIGVLAAGIAKAKGFAKGGVIGGSSYSGDRQIAKVNAGETVITAHQMGNLFKLLDGNVGANGGKEITFKLRGTDIIGAIKNTESRIRG